MYSHYLRGIISVLFVSVLAVSCQNAGQSEQAQQTPGGQWPKASKYVANETTSIPVYKWPEMKTILNETNDDTTYVFNFWATWCKPCIQELPLFEKLSKNYQDQPVKVVLVSLDFEDALEPSLLPYVTRKKFLSKVVVLNEPNANLWINQVDSSWSGAIPATLIKKGNKTAFHEKRFEPGELEEAFLKIYR